MHRSFDLQAGPVALCAIIHAPGRRSRVVLVMNHFVSDGTSMRLLGAELVASYNRLAQGLPHRLVLDTAGLAPVGRERAARVEVEGAEGSPVLLGGVGQRGPGVRRACGCGPVWLPLSGHGVDMMGSRSTVLAGWTLTLIRNAEDWGISQRELMSTIGLDDSTLQDPDSRIPADIDLAAWREMRRRSGDEFFGLHLAEKKITPASGGVVGYIAMSRATVEEAILAVVRYKRLIKVHTHVRYHEPDPSTRIIEIEPQVEDLPADLADASMASYIILARRWTGRHLRPRKVLLQRPRPADASEFERVFDCPVVFHQTKNVLIYDRATVESPLQTADPLLAAYLERVASQSLAGLPTAQPSLDNDIREAIAAQLSNGELQIERVAKALGMSVRTLQRRLKDQALAYQNLVDLVRHEQALKLLTDEQVSIGEVGYRLGFSEPSAFRRAFKRWTGQGPSEYLRRAPEERGAGPISTVRKRRAQESRADEVAKVGV
jgi:AraC-like DNA-binding protein